MLREKQQNLDRYLPPKSSQFGRLWPTRLDKIKNFQLESQIGDIVMEVPSAYKEGHRKARLIDKEVADNYVGHTQVGDPVMDAIVKELASLPQHQVHRFIQAGMDGDRDGMRNAPRLLRDFFVDAPQPDPDWLDYDPFMPVSYTHLTLPTKRIV